MYLHTEQQSAAGKQTGCNHTGLVAPLMVAYKPLPPAFSPSANTLPSLSETIIKNVTIVMHERAVQSTEDLYDSDVLKS